MGKKQAKEKKFDRNVEISAPILDPEIIKAIHSPPKFGGLDMKHGGFKALLADLHSQDSTEDVMPICEKHQPSYIGISCALSGYTNYSQYSKGGSHLSTDSNGLRASARALKKTPTNQSRTTSPTFKEFEAPINHITIDKENLQSPEQERKEFTEKLTASVADKQRRSPSPCIHPTVDDRHHGAYVGARYCPMPPPSQEVIKHIPLLGIDDEKDPDEAVLDEAKAKSVENKIASIYGEDFVEDWKEAQTHKAKREDFAPDDEADKQTGGKFQPKDLVNLRPAPVREPDPEPVVHVDAPNIKVMENIDKSFLTKILTDDQPIFPRESAVKEATAKRAQETIEAKPRRPDEVLVRVKRTGEPISLANEQEPEQQNIDSQEANIYAAASQSPTLEETREVLHQNTDIVQDKQQSPSPDLIIQVSANSVEQEIVPSAPPESEQLSKQPPEQQPEQPSEQSYEQLTEEPTSPEGDKVGERYLQLMDEEICNINTKIARAEGILKAESLSDDASGMVMSAIGKANLLINDKCNQFRGLCIANLNQTGTEQYKTLNEDLAGFWDMLLLQINEVNNSFESLFDESESNWQGLTEKIGNSIVSDAPKPAEAVKQTGAAKLKLSEQKDNERRKKLQEHINQMKAAGASSTPVQDENEELLLDLTPEKTAINNT